MFKYPHEDLRRLYGVEVHELNVWRPLVEHLVEQLALGRLLTHRRRRLVAPRHGGSHLPLRAPEDDGVGPDDRHRGARRSATSTTSGYFDLDGEDYDELLAGRPGSRRTWRACGRPAAPSGVPVDVRRAVALAREHLARRPDTNPITRFAKRLEEDLPWLAAQDIDTFHRYAFGMVRQCGSNAELAASFVDWLGANDPAAPALGDVAEQLGRIATGMKSLEFLVARAVRGRVADLGPATSELAAAWQTAMDELAGPMDPEPAGDLLSGRAWECAHSPPGALAGPDDLEAAGLDWLAASVPGTAAGARAAAGFVDVDSHPYDDDDWWFRCRFDAADGHRPAALRGPGDRRRRLAERRPSAPLREHVPCARASDGPLQGGANELVIRCAALAPRLAERRSRPRWKTYMVTHQNLRWFRTSLLGRIPGWAGRSGPRRPVAPGAAAPGAGPGPAPVRLVASCEGDDGIVEATIRLPATVPPGARRRWWSPGSAAPFERAAGRRRGRRSACPVSSGGGPTPTAPSPSTTSRSSSRRRPHRLGPGRLPHDRGGPHRRRLPPARQRRTGLLSRRLLAPARPGDAGAADAARSSTTAWSWPRRPT